VPTGVDRRALQHYLTLQYVPEPASLHTGIARIESGTSFTVSPGGKLVPERYFHPHFHPREIRSCADARMPHDDITAITAALRDSVAHHMRAYVTVGGRIPLRRDRLHSDCRTGS
jgi:asparagine synthase (glutamine-hydrolysing)